ncbi:MAG: ABC transporter permease [Proteobacteria bacterium]|nr:ABC transporter permease [Pseudomonadota bacterium]
MPTLFVACFFMVPLIYAVGLSFGLPNFTAESYHHLVDSPVYRIVYLKTLKVALITTVTCLLLGYPTAYFVSRLHPRARATAVMLIALPFMLSVLVRNYVWMTMLQDTGVINRLLMNLGFTKEPVQLMYNQLGVTIAMVNMLVPYVIFPVLTSLMAIPPNLKVASASLGGNRLSTFLRVTLPLTATGTAAGALLTFIIALGFYITPAMLGGPREMMISSLIAFNVREVLNWPFAFSLATTLLGSTIVLYLAYRAVAPRGVVVKPI